MGRRMDDRSPSLAITHRTQSRWRVFRSQGELTYATCNELAQALDIPAGGTGRPCAAVDASGLEFFDSSGIRSLLIAAKRAQDQGGEFVVLDAGPMMRRIHWMYLIETPPVMATLSV